MAGIPMRCAIRRRSEEDVLRRDFTINGMLLDPLGELAGTAATAVLDYVGGRADLEGRDCARHRRSRCGASQKTSCACCVPCDLRRDSASSSSPRRSRRFAQLAATIHAGEPRADSRRADDAC